MSTLLPFQALSILGEIIDASLLELWDADLEFEDWVGQTVHEIEIEFGGDIAIVTVLGERLFFDARNMDANYNPYTRERFA